MGNVKKKNLQWKNGSGPHRSSSLLSISFIDGSAPVTHPYCGPHSNLKEYAPHNPSEIFQMLRGAAPKSWRVAWLGNALPPRAATAWKKTAATPKWRSCHLVVKHLQNWAPHKEFLLQGKTLSMTKHWRMNTALEDYSHDVADVHQEYRVFTNALMQGIVRFTPDANPLRSNN